MAAMISVAMVCSVLPHALTKTSARAGFLTVEKETNMTFARFNLKEISQNFSGSFQSVRWRTYCFGKPHELMSKWLSALLQ